MQSNTAAQFKQEKQEKLVTVQKDANKDEESEYDEEEYDDEEEEE